MSRILIIPLLAVLLAMATTVQAGERHHERRWHHGDRLLKQERRVERHAWRKTWRRLERAEHRGERRAWRAWRRCHRPVIRHRFRSFPPHRPHGHVYRPFAPALHVRYRYHGYSGYTSVDPLPVIGGGVVGGVVGNTLGDGDPMATTAGLFIGSMVGYELGRH